MSGGTVSHEVVSEEVTAEQSQIKQRRELCTYLGAKKFRWRKKQVQRP